jgi:putative CocE/NonD family hydrolase
MTALRVRNRHRTGSSGAQSAAAVSIPQRLAAARRTTLAAQSIARVANPLCFVLLLALVHSLAHAQEFDFHPPPSASDPATPGVMRDLAERILPVYQENDVERYLANLSALQLTSGNYAAAYATQQSLRERRQHEYPNQLSGRELVSDIYVRARAIEAQDHVSFAQAFTQSFQDLALRLDNPDTFTLIKRLRTPVSVLQADLQKALDAHRAKGTIAMPEAIDLIRTYLAYDAFRSFAPLIDTLDTDDDRRRYITDRHVPIELADGRSISAVIVRPRTPTKPLPTLLEVRLEDAGQNYAKECAAHGYVGVVASIRGNPKHPETVIPFQHDGEDARAVIEWIAKQSWSDGRVGMYGGSYSSFVQWAAAKHLPAALRAIATSTPNAPGITSPLTGNIFRNSSFRFSYCATHNQPADEESCAAEAPWRTLDRQWYTSGRAYRDLGRVFGKHNRIFQRWLNHPSYDRFWQKLIPFQEEFAHIDIPVLSVTGYYADSENGALYYFTQHSRYDPHANHTLFIGPYDDGVMQHGAQANLHGYPVDASALVDLRELRYQWFDSVFKGSAKPDLLAARVNYEVMGTNEWHHAASLEDLAKQPQRFYLDPGHDPQTHRLALKEPAKAAFSRQAVNLADRKDALWNPSVEIVSKELKTRDAVTFVSEPLAQPLEFSGLFSARLDFVVNKMDMDLTMALYELLPSGDYVALFTPAEELRASYVRDRVHRHLLGAGERQQLAITADRLTSRKLQSGSRLVFVLGVNKRPDREINYGTGDDVSVESISDAQEPLKIRWYGSSYIDVPVQR